MHDSVRRELRLLGLLVAILFAYGACVIAYAAAYGQLRLLVPGAMSNMLVSIWTVAFAFVFAGYGIDLILRRRPARPLQVMIAEFRGNVLRPDLLLARAGVVLGWYLLMRFFTPAKVMIGNVQGFPLDATLADFDQALFLGHDPWELTHALFGGVLPTFVLQFAYNVWFLIMWLTVIYAVLRPEYVMLRARYILAFVLCWMLVGSAAATMLASAGPCFYEQAFGDPRFAPLMARLASVDAELRAINPEFGVWALNLQDMLWTSFTAKEELFGGGISAMPSMHVAQAVLMALAARSLGPRIGAAAWVYAAVIWIGSVHLGWHYATDGIVGGAMAWAIWRLSGWLVERFVLAEPAPAAAVAA